MGLLGKLRGRSLAEVKFRLRQELSNAWMAWRPPSPRLRGEKIGLPEVEWEGLRGTRFAAEAVKRCEGLLAGRWEMLGYRIEVEGEPDWRRDWVHGTRSELAYQRRVKYLDFGAVGDHKVVWEPSRHQHLVLLAQAWRLTGRAEFRTLLERHWDSWVAENPLEWGVHWTSALEVAFRAWSWIWVWHWCGAEWSAERQERFLRELYRHGAYLERNLSIYFAPNTHLLGEAVVLHALGTLFPSWPRAGVWRETGGRITAETAARQVGEDGAHFEQSSYYHVYATDMLLWHYLVAGRPEEQRGRLEKMAGYLEAAMGQGRRLPFWGDEDGGRCFHPYGEAAEFGRATLETCGQLWGRKEWRGSREDWAAQAAWWLGGEFREERVERVGRSFYGAASGLGVMESGAWTVWVKAGGFGSGAAGHSHADVLSVLASWGGEEWLVESGTGTYLGDVRQRDWFRGTGAHNTVRVNGQDQGKTANPFRWAERPEARTLGWESNAGEDRLRAEVRYRGVRHEREVILLKRRGWLVVVDEVEGEVERAEQIWHAGVAVEPAGEGVFRLGGSGWLYLDAGLEGRYEVGGELGWRSRAYGQREESPVVVGTWRGGVAVTVLAAGEVLTGGVLAGRPSVEGDVIRWGGEEVTRRQPR